jgi:ABC-type antimicrobial peptide transport system permease subunit
LLTALHGFPGATVLRMYDGPGRAADDAVMSCDDLRHFAVLGRCAPGVAAVEVATSLFTDNLAAVNATLPIVTANSTAVTGNLADLNLVGVLVSVDSPVMLEQVRTLLTTYTALSGADVAPQTFGEVGQERDRLYLEIRSVVTVIAGLTLLVAGCSVAIAVTGNLVERKRPFTLLRLCGTSTRTLYGVVLLETALPLAAATLIAAATGYAIAIPIARTLAPARHVIPILTPTYYIILGSGLLFAAAVNVASLPILGRITRPDSIRFE